MYMYMYVPLQPFLPLLLHCWTLWLLAHQSHVSLCYMVEAWAVIAIIANEVTTILVEASSMLANFLSFSCSRP